MWRTVCRVKKAEEDRRIQVMVVKWTEVKKHRLYFGEDRAC